MQQAYSKYFLLIFAAIVFPQYAQAYIDPGASDSALGTAIVVIGVILLALVALLWYPLKNLFGKKKKGNLD